MSNPDHDSYEGQRDGGVMTVPTIHRQRRQRGSLRLEAQGWVLRVRDDVTATDGALTRTERRIHIGRMDTRAQARRAADVLLSRLNPGGARIGAGITVAQFSEIFLTDHIGMLKPTTAAAMRSIVRRRLVPIVGGCRLDELSGHALQGLVNRMHGEGCSRKTIKNSLSVLSSLMRLARARGLPCALLDRATIKLPPVGVDIERRHFTMDEMAKVVGAAPWPSRALFALLSLAGLRAGEALALRWTDIDTAAATIRIRQAVAFRKLQTPKSAGSAASLPVPPAMLDVLAAYRPHWPANPHELLFAGPDGQPLLSSDVRRKWLRPLLHQLRIAPGGLHSFRHGFATSLFQSGASAATVKALMRHSDVRVTLRYTHVLPNEMREATARLATHILPVDGHL